jgi:hypothetical protein
MGFLRSCGVHSARGAITGSGIRDRHHRGSAPVSGSGAMGRLAPEQSWRSPEGRDNLGFPRTQRSPPQEENAHGQAYRAGSIRGISSSGCPTPGAEVESVAAGTPSKLVAPAHVLRRGASAPRSRCAHRPVDGSQVDGPWRPEPRGPRVRTPGRDPASVPGRGVPGGAARRPIGGPALRAPGLEASSMRRRHPGGRAVPVPAPPRCLVLPASRGG